MTWTTQTPSVFGVVGVEAACYEFAAVDGPVVGVLAGFCAAEYARRIFGEYGGPEAGLVLAAVSALPCAAASLLGFAPVVWALPALIGVFGTARCRAYSPACTSGHGDLPSGHDLVEAVCAQCGSGMLARMSDETHIALAGPPIKRRFRWLLGTIGLVMGAVTVACGPSGSNSAKPQPSTFTLSGTVTLIRGATDAPDGVSCAGWSGMGFGKVAEGASVTVFGKDGTKVATGTLGLGKAPAGYAVPCRFAVRVPGVPAGVGPYEVRVADQKMVTVSEAKAKAGGFVSSLG
jgi:hypothetical protein